MSGESKKADELGNLRKTWDNVSRSVPIIFWSAMTCFAMLGNIGDGQNRVVHALGNIENDLEYIC